MRSACELLEVLGLSSFDGLEDLATRRQSFDCLHTGMQPLRIDTLLTVVRSESHLLPPRTGHLGNWEEIVHGRSGATDFNKAICGNRYGHALIYCFTQTESEAGGTRAGDWVYLPGSIIEQGNRRELPLHTWDGTAFVRRTRENPLFCPFVKTEMDGALVPLLDVHWRRMRALGLFEFRLEAATIMAHQEELRSMLAVLLEAASRQTNSNRAFSDLVSHAVSPAGAMARAALRREGNGYWLEDCHYPSVDALIEHALIPFQAVVDPPRVLDRKGELPALLPILSNLLVAGLTAIFRTHYPNLAPVPTELSSPYNAHFHWGARDMAGYPPRRRGYMMEKSTRKTLRSLCSTLMSQFKEVDPVLFVLLPASIFMLCPADVCAPDAELLAELFRELPEDTAGTDPIKAEQLARAVETATNGWLSRRGAALSPYFRSRFLPRSGGLDAASIARSEPVEPEGFRNLTVRQACMVVGALMEASTPAA